MALRTTDVTIPMTDDLRRFIEREAKREERSIAGQVRYWIVQAMRAEQQQPPERASSRNSKQVATAA